LISKRIIPFLKERGETTSLIYIKDLIDGILQAALSPNTNRQIYYLTDGKGYSWRTLILSMKRQILGKKLFFPVPESIIYGLAWLTDMIKATGIARPYFGRRIWRAMTQTLWLFSSSKAQKDFGFRAKYGLAEGIKDTVASYSKPE
jgi:nucleoside-diphosphate-sugar epimerase